MLTFDAIIKNAYKLWTRKQGHITVRVFFNLKHNIENRTSTL